MELLGHAVTEPIHKQGSVEAINGAFICGEKMLCFIPPAAIHFLKGAVVIATAEPLSGPSSTIVLPSVGGCSSHPPAVTRAVPEPQSFAAL